MISPVAVAPRLLAWAARVGVIAALSAACMLSAITQDAPVGGWVGTNVAAAQRPDAAPTWESHGGATGCRPLRTGELADTVLVVVQRGDVVRMGFDTAWARATDAERANDVFVIGACR